MGIIDKINQAIADTDYQDEMTDEFPEFDNAWESE